LLGDSLNKGLHRNLAKCIVVLVLKVHGTAAFRHVLPKNQFVPFDLDRGMKERDIAISMESKYADAPLFPSTSNYREHLSSPGIASAFRALFVSVSILEECRKKEEKKPTLDLPEHGHKTCARGARKLKFGTRHHLVMKNQ
jgi:hypothetical protein